MRTKYTPEQLGQRFRAIDRIIADGQREQLRIIIELYKCPLSIYEVGMMIGRSASTVSEVAINNGCPPRRDSSIRDKVRSELRSAKTQSQIAAVLGVSPQTVYHHKKAIEREEVAV